MFLHHNVKGIPHWLIGSHKKGEHTDISKLDLTKELDLKYRFAGSILAQRKDAGIDILEICQERLAIFSNELTEVVGQG